MKKLRTALVLAVAACAFAAIPGVAAAAVPGGISGRVTDAPSGLPAQSVSVCAYTAVTHAFEGCGSTNVNGEYVINEVEAGAYKVEFSRESPISGSFYVTQWFSGKPTFLAADPVSVVEGLVTPNVNAAMYGRGRISGTVTDAGNGVPIAGIEVCAGGIESNSIFAFFFNCTKTDANGQYLTEGLGAGSYKVEFGSPFKYNESLEKSELDGPNYVTQYYNGQARPETAGAVPVADGVTTSGINAALQAAGTITGNVTDAVSGASLQGVVVCAWGASEFQCSSTDTGGNYAIPTLASGSYKVEFTPEYFFNKAAFKEGKRTWVRSELPLADYVRQYYNNKFSFEAAEAVTAAAGATVSNINAKLTKEVQPAPAPTNGVASAGKKAKVQDGKARLAVKCSSSGPCKGSLSLTAQAVTTVRKKGGKAKKTMHKVVIGRAPFSIAAGKSATVAVPINGAGKVLLSKAGAKGLKVEIAGSGVEKSTLQLTQGSGKKKHSKN